MLVAKTSQLENTGTIDRKPATNAKEKGTQIKLNKQSFLGKSDLGSLKLRSTT
jgi:hypothetical protein